MIESVLKNPKKNMPRTDYPRPMWMRNEWYCLNGEWDFEFDFGASGIERGMIENGDYTKKINVPFCPESKLSGIEYTDFMKSVWYRKKVELHCPEGQRAILHFGAVDYQTRVWVNGKFCGSHKGGYCAFEFDVTSCLVDGENTITVYATDDIKSYKQPRGKQASAYKSHDCSYTRTTGIWQTVWLEFVPDKYLITSKMTPHASSGSIDINLKANDFGMKDYYVKLEAFYDGKLVGEKTARFVGDRADVSLEVSEVHLWDVLSPELYDLKIQLFREGEKNATDTVYSYFALRDIAFNENGLTVNGRNVFMRLILDQGFNPDGIYTAPSAEFLEKDIDMAIELGFNGARLHQRIFEDRTLYYADKKGYIVWIEYANGSDLSTPEDTEIMLAEWLEVINSHYSHPAVVGWCPLNETYHDMALHEGTHTMLYRVTKELDPYRPVIDASGGIHYLTDMYDIHDYQQDPEKLAASYAPMLTDPNAFYNPTTDLSYRGAAPLRKGYGYFGQPYWVSEYGGALWNPRYKNQSCKVFGYGKLQTEEAFAERYEKLTDVLLSHPRICGFCYTQLTDVEQEQNGLYYYDREKKFSPEIYERIRLINQKRAAVEKE